MSKCPNCKREEKRDLVVDDFFPVVKQKKCFNCRKKYIWIRLLRENYFLARKSLL